MRFAFIDAEKASYPVTRMCRVLGGSQSGYFAWKDRPVCARQRQDLVCLAHIRLEVPTMWGAHLPPLVTIRPEIIAHLRARG
jgi:hypothetical protein